LDPTQPLRLTTTTSTEYAIWHNYMSQDTLPSPFPISSLSKYYYSYCTTSDVYCTPVCTTVSTTVWPMNKTVDTVVNTACYSRDCLKDNVVHAQKCTTKAPPKKPKQKKSRLFGPNSSPSWNRFWDHFGKVCMVAEDLARKKMAPGGARQPWWREVVRWPSATVQSLEMLANTLELEALSLGTR